MPRARATQLTGQEARGPTGTMECGLHCTIAEFAHVPLVQQIVPDLVEQSHLLTVDHFLYTYCIIMLPNCIHYTL